MQWRVCHVRVLRCVDFAGEVFSPHRQDRADSRRRQSAVWRLRRVSVTSPNGRHRCRAIGGPDHCSLVSCSPPNTVRLTPSNRTNCRSDTRPRGCLCRRPERARLATIPDTPGSSNCNDGAAGGGGAAPDTFGHSTAQPQCKVTTAGREGRSRGDSREADGNRDTTPPSFPQAHSQVVELSRARRVPRSRLLRWGKRVEAPRRHPTRRPPRRRARPPHRPKGH
jgi:hypothetical protein